MQIKLPKNLPDELLYGRVGFLWACLFLNKHLGQGTIPSTYTVILALEYSSAIMIYWTYRMVKNDVKYFLKIFRLRLWMKL